GGAESKRRRRPRLPAPPSRVTLLVRRYAPRPQPAQVQAAQARSHSSRTFVTPRNMKRRRAIACLLAACRRITCGTRAGPNSAAGRSSDLRSAYEAPRAAVDGSTRVSGAESKRRRRPRLPAPPSRVTLLARLFPDPDPVQARRVLEHDLPPLRGRDVLHHLPDDPARVRPVAAVVRVVGRPHDVVDADRVAVRDPV